MESRTSGVPAPAPHELRRERLLELLHRHSKRPLVLLVAPAGFGKSTLAAAYARDSGAAVAWLTLQPADRDTRRLFSRLADALEKGFEEPDPVPELRKGLADGAEGVGLARLLLADLAQAPAGFIVVLDDYHLISDSAEVANTVDTLIRELPEDGQIVITARDAPALSMTKLLVDEALFPLGMEELRFLPDETRALREKRGGDPTRDEQAEGWVAGILLGGAPRQLGVGGGSLLEGYVEREILERLSPTEKGWLEMLSVFDIITPRTAERVLGEGPWQSRLISLTERCPFLSHGTDGTYRLHGLVRETVLNRLRRSPDDRAAIAWSAVREIAEEHSDAAGVVRACQELGQIEKAVEVVRRTTMDAVTTGRWAAVLVTLELLPESVRRAHPDLSLIEAQALFYAGQTDRARDAAEEALKHGGRTGDVCVQISALVAMARVTLTTDMEAAEDWLAAAEHLLRNTQLAPDQRRALEGTALGVRGVHAALRSEVAEARDSFENAARLLSLLGPSRDLAMVQQNFGTFCVRIGDYQVAQRALAAATSHWRVMGDRNGLALSQLALGDLHVRLCELEAAGAALTDGLAAARAVGAVRLEAWATVMVGQWHRANGRIDEAIAAFDEGLRLAEAIVERELLAQALCWRAEVALLQEDMSTARQLLARSQAEAQRSGVNSVLAVVERGMGRLHLVDGADSRAVHHFLEAMERGGESWGADQRAQTRYWLGTAYLSLGRAQQAANCLEQAIHDAQQVGMTAPLVGPAAEDARLLRHGRDLALSPSVLAEVERMAQMRRPWTGVRPQPKVTLVGETQLPRLELQLFGSFVIYRNGELVTKPSRRFDRARELAALLALNPKGLSDEVIAERMFPDMPRESAVHNLQMAAYSLRRDLDCKPAVRYSARSYQLNPQLEMTSDVDEFDAALARARRTTGDNVIQALSKAVDLYRGPLLADAAWEWIEPARLEYRSRYVQATLELADLLAPLDPARSDDLAEKVLAEAPETDMAYERLIVNTRRHGDPNAVRRAVKRYQMAAAQFGFVVRQSLIDDDQAPRGRAAR